MLSYEHRFEGGRCNFDRKLVFFKGYGTKKLKNFRIKVGYCGGGDQTKF